MRNEIRIGWGDQLFESLVWHNPTYTVTTMPATWTNTTKENYRHHQHLWLEYQYRFSHWFSLGAMMDMSEVGWDNVTRNGTGTILHTGDPQYFYNLVFMPTLRFTWVFHPYVNLYSAAFVGLTINGGTEQDFLTGRHTVLYPAFGLTMLGCRVGGKGWYGTVEWGGLSALRDINSISMASSRIIAVSLAYQFNSKPRKQQP